MFGNLNLFRHGIDLDKGAAANDDVRQIENGSPPMHFLTPHVEISMAETSHNRTVSPKTQVRNASSYFISNIT